MPRFLVKHGPMPLEGLGWAHAGDVVEVREELLTPYFVQRYGEVLPDITAPIAEGETLPPHINEHIDLEPVDGDPSEEDFDVPDISPKSTAAPRDKMVRAIRKKETP